MAKSWHSAISFATAMLYLHPATARELPVGPTRTLTLPSQAATIAADGDVIRIDPGIYADCATWSASRLVIEATAPGVLIAGKTCGGKAIFIIEGADIAIRGITFADASVAEHNGAGIRVAGNNLTVEYSRFVNNENGILAGGDQDSVLRIIDSEFVGNGACINACAHGVYAGAPIPLLAIERCVFLDTRIGHHIKSRARETVIHDTRIEDGPTGTASYLIDIPNGGNVLIQGNRMQKGLRSSNPAAAISIGAEGVSNPTDTLVIRDNVFSSDLPNQTAFIRDHARTPVVSDNNKISGNVILLEIK